ncbi:MAG: YcaO-like family protein [Acidobacteriaceae bacterium]
MPPINTSPRNLSSQKVDGLDRVFGASETFDRLREIGNTLGVRRMADITGLDRVGIPVYSAIVPLSDDALSVYNGKGLRPIDAKVGALMESIERQTALKARLPYIEATYRQLSQQARTLDPWKINQALFEDFTPESLCSWVRGTDLFSGEQVWVPAHLAGYLWNDVPHRSPFTVNDSNGLASGNNRLEAVYHALCELIERDSWSLAELGASFLPAARSQIIRGSSAGHSDDLEHCPSVEIPQDNELFRAFREAGLDLQVRDISSALQVPAFVASVADESIFGFPMAHAGFGCNPNANVALRRAITEVAQSRCVDIQSVREDIVDSNAPKETFAPHTKRIAVINRRSWVTAESRTRRPFEAIESHRFDDLNQDLQWLMERLQSAGLSEAIVVDFTPGCTTHSVVRVIVPGIELWASDHGRVGPRAVEFWNQHA